LKIKIKLMNALQINAKYTAKRSITQFVINQFKKGHYDCG
jgi:hypothetical protein